MEGMNQVLGIVSQYFPWFDRNPNLDHILATIVSPLPVLTGAHKILQLSSQWTEDIMTPLVNDQCRIQSIQSLATIK